MSKLEIKSKTTTLRVYQICHQRGTRLFTVDDIRADCPETPPGTVSAAISQMSYGGLLEVLGKRAGVFVYRLLPIWRDAGEESAIKQAAEAVNRQARVRFEKAGLHE